MIIAFAVPGEPKGKARPRTVQIAGHASTYTPKETVMYENLVRLYYQQAARGLRLSGPIQAEIVSYSSVPKSTSKKKRALMWPKQFRQISTNTRALCLKLISWWPTSRTCENPTRNDSKQRRKPLQVRNSKHIGAAFVRRLGSQFCELQRQRQCELQQCQQRQWRLACCRAFGFRNCT